MTINDKIKHILIDKNFSPSYFADEIGVQRSSISHILSGRNRPSFDIIQKIIRRFPELGYDWIMEEDSLEASPRSQVGVPPNRSGLRSTATYPSDHSVSRPLTSSYSPGVVRSQRTEIPPAGSLMVGGAPVDSQIPDGSVIPDSGMRPTVEKKVERILIFYTDGSFREYTPA